MDALRIPQVRHAERGERRRDQRVSIQIVMIDRRRKYPVWRECKHTVNMVSINLDLLDYRPAINQARYVSRGARVRGCRHPVCGR